LILLETAMEQGAESGKYLCKRGDVVYSKIRPVLRKVCIAPEDCLCSADMYPLRAHSGLTNGFLLWFILSEPFSAFAVLESDRVAMPKINRESLKELMLAVPPIDEQQTIIAFLDTETAKIDTLVAEAERAMSLLKERRTALISAAVTGKINVIRVSGGLQC
jgi:type I restriction enzyme S subunit